MNSGSSYHTTQKQHHLIKQALRAGVDWIDVEALSDTIEKEKEAKGASLEAKSNTNSSYSSLTEFAKRYYPFTKIISSCHVVPRVESVLPIIYVEIDIWGLKVDIYHHFSITIIQVDRVTSALNTIGLLDKCVMVAGGADVVKVVTRASSKVQINKCASIIICA